MWWTELSTDEEDKMEDKTNENYAQIENNLLEYDKINWLPETTEFKDQDLTLYFEPENEMLVEFTGDHHFVMYNDDGEMLVDMNLEDGSTFFGSAYTPDEAAKVFWETIGKVKVTEKNLTMCESSNEKDKSSKVEVLSGDEMLGLLPGSSLEYFRDKLAQATTSDESHKLEKQIELLEDSIVIYHEHRPSSFKTFDDAMKVID